MILRTQRNLIQVFLSGLFNFYGTTYANELFFFKIMFFIKTKTLTDPLELTLQALYNIYPLFALRSKKVAGIKYKIPVLLSLNKSNVNAVKILLTAAKERTGAFSMEEKIALEIIDAALKKGFAYRFKEKLYGEIDENRPFLRYLRTK